MNESVKQTSSTPHAAIGEAVAVPRAVVHRGPETVINPEGRPAPLPLADQPALPASSIVRTLFPHIEENAPEPRSGLLEGVQLGHFTILERIRSGGMGAVFRALDTRLNRVVALKVLPPALSRDLSAVQRFRNEAQAAAQLDHENIARVFYIGEDQGLHFIAFEFVNGTNIRDLIQQQRHLQVSDAVNYTLQIASALLHTSEQGVVHRDIKPSNIIITPQERAKLVDMGLARKENRDEAGADLTLAGTTLGTFDYISPEQARDPRTADVRSDIYSLGCTLYHMLTGEPPYPEGTVLQKLLQHQGDDAPDPVLKNRHVPENLSAIVRKMMTKDPRRRYQTAEQLVRDLMLLAGAMGLRSVSAEGLIWMAAQNTRTPFWERHLAWMATVAALLLIVGYMEFGGSRFSPQTTGGAKVADPPGANLKYSGPPAVGSLNPAVNPPAAGPGESALMAPETVTKAEASSKRTTPYTGESTAPVVVETEPGESTLPNPRPASRQASAESGVALGPPFAPDLAALSPQPLVAESAAALGPVAATSGLRSLPQVTSLGPTESVVAGDPQDSNPVTKSAASKIPTETVRPGSERPDKTELSPPANLPEPAISIVAADGGIGQSYPTLEAACSAAENGAVIELRFNGKRREKPLRVTRKITIRAGRGYRPGIEFLPAEVPAEGHRTRMITVTNGAVEVVGVDLLLTVDDSIPVDQWSLFAIHRPESVRLQGATITLHNPRSRPAAVFELHSGLAANMPEMEMGKNSMKPPLEIRLSGSLVRGTGDLFLLRNQEPARLALKESVVALQGSLLSALGGVDMPAENLLVELQIDHVTAALAGSLVRLDSGTIPRRLLPVQVSTSNSIFSSTTAEPLVSMLGNAPTQDFRPLLVWSGKRNFYDRYETLWTITSTEGFGRTETQDFSAWQKSWGPATEVDPHADRIAWKRPWTGKPFAELTPADFALDAQAANNPAVSGATDFGDAGANVAALAKLAPPAE